MLLSRSDDAYVIRDNDTVHKVFQGEDARYSRDDELKILENIQQIDPDNTFTVKFVNDMFDYEGNPEIIQEYGGETLYEFDATIDYTTFVKMFNIFADGINKMHNNGIVHRDIKLTNILVSQYKFSLIDFGLACKTSQVYTTPMIHILGHSPYVTYPPEYKLAHHLYSNRPNSKATSKDMVKYVNENFLECIIIDDLLSQQKTIPWVRVINKVFTKFARKADIYAIGVTMLMFLKNVSCIPIQEKYLQNVFNTMAEPNPYKRVKEVPHL